MRYLRIAAVVLLVASILFAGWANNRYYSGLNRDFPEITNTEQTLQISTEDPPEAIFRGLSAWDKTDGDLTKEIMVASVSHFLEPGTVRVKYVVFDDHNNSATLSRLVCYTDYQKPRFSLEKAPVYTVGTPFDLLDYVKVEDVIDGDISDRIRVLSNMVNNYTAGNYPVVLEVSNSGGDTAQVTLWVHYVSKESSAVVSLSRYIVYVEQGAAFAPERYLTGVTDLSGAKLSTSGVEIQGSLDTGTPGTYQLVFSYDDGKRTGQSPLTVVVTERQG